MVDFLDELLEDDEKKDETGKLPSRDDVSALTEEIEALKKEKAGLLKGVKEERSKRQEISGRLNQLTETVQGILSQREQQQAALDSIDNPKADKLPVTWTEDGEGFVSVDQFEELISPMQEELEMLRNQVTHSTAQVSSDREAERIKNAIVGEDEKFEPAYRKYQAARKMVADMVTDYAIQNGLKRQLTGSQALDDVFSSKEAVEEFNAAHPGLDVADILLAEDSKALFRRTLTNISKTLEPEPKTPDSRFQQVLKKPSSIGEQANAKAGNLTIADKVNSLSPEDISNLSDAQAEALLRAMEAEEKSDGVNF